MIVFQCRLSVVSCFLIKFDLRLSTVSCQKRFPLGPTDATHRKVTPIGFDCYGIEIPMPS